MEQLTPAQQLEMAPLLSAFPTLNMTAEGYLASTYTVTYIYNGSMTDFQSYAAILLASGFTNVAGTYSKIDPRKFLKIKNDLERRFKVPVFLLGEEPDMEMLYEHVVDFFSDQ